MPYGAYNLPQHDVKYRAIFMHAPFLCGTLCKTVSGALQVRQASRITLDLRTLLVIARTRFDSFIAPKSWSIDERRAPQERNLKNRQVNAHTKLNTA